MGLRFLLLSFLTSVTHAQNSDSISYKKTFDEKVLFGVYSSSISNSFVLENNQSLRTELTPIVQGQTGFNLSYKFIDVSLGFSSKNKDLDAQRLNSKFFGFNTRFFYKKWVQSFTYLKQEGFDVKQEQKVQYLASIKSRKIGGTTTYIFNDNFSYKALVNQKEIQLKTAGSFLLNFSVFKNDFDLQAFNNHLDVNYKTSLALAYHHNWVLFDDFFLSTGANIGTGFYFSERVSPLLEVAFSLALAYNTDSFYVFLGSNVQRFLHKSSEDVVFYDDLNEIKLTFGYRFHPPQKIKDWYRKAENRVFEAVINKK
jgi:hypothetical protein